VCHAKGDLFAHHILRKSLLVEARLQTGNGITLCRACHSEPHEGFNRRPNLALPMDAENGEKIELLTDCFDLLLSDARTRGTLRDDFYFLDDQVLAKCKMLQDFDPFTPVPGYRLEQAVLIWKQSPKNVRDAILKANGFLLPDNFLIPSGSAVIFYE